MKCPSCNKGLLIETTNEAGGILLLDPDNLEQLEDALWRAEQRLEDVRQDTRYPGGSNRHWAIDCHVDRLRKHHQLLLAELALAAVDRS